MHESTTLAKKSPAIAAASARGQEVVRLRDLSPQQWKSGIAAWLGWLFDGLDMHLYTLVATPFVAELLAVGQKDESVGYYGSWIQAAFLVGWALGGGFFGRIGDRVGRAHALTLTILTYALFTGLSFFAQTWWHLLICRFLAALGIGGEWAVGAALLSETWPHRWCPWIAAVLQTAVNIGIMLAMHDVSATTVSRAAANHGGRFLLQHRPAGRSGRHDLSRSIRPGGQLSPCPFVRRLPIPPFRCRGILPAGTARW